MRIKINIQIFAIIIILWFTKQIEVYAWLMLFTLIHELAHMTTGMLLKLKPKTLEIQPFGISILFDSFKNTEKNKIIIAIAGPLINILITIIFLFLNINMHTKELIINSNILLAVFNLIPIYPLDGGRILKSILRIKNEPEKADKIVNTISNVLTIIITVASSILILIYKNIGLFIIVIYLWVIVIKENNLYKLKSKISNVINN